MKDKRIKLVVLNEHTLGYILPVLPNYVQVLHASLLKGAPFELNPSNKLIGKLDKVRLASAKDFENYRCCFKGFNNPVEYEFLT